MAEKLNATCAICGKKYHKCVSCKSQLASAPWKIHTDTSEHYKIFQVIHGFSAGVYTKDEARERLRSIDLSDLNSLRDNIKKIIKDIMKEDKKAQKTVKPVEQAKPVVGEVVEANEDAQPSFVGRKKDYSAMVEPKTEEG